jgi:chromosome segregation ATPase
MKKSFIPLVFALGFCWVGCNQTEEQAAEQPMTQEQCVQTLCTKDQCFIWSEKLNRCGTADALKKEENRLKKLAERAEKKDSAKAELPKAVRDSLSKINKKKKNLTNEIDVLNKNIDSLRVADSLSKKTLTAEAYLKGKLDEQKKALDAKYAALIDSVKILNLVNRKPITAVQWLEYNKRKKSTKIEQLDKKAQKLKK